MIYSLFLVLFLGYEIQKLLQFNFFFRIRCILTDYYKEILKKTNTVAYKEIVKISLTEVLYFIVLFIGLFTINLHFICGIFLLSVIQHYFFKYIKNKNDRQVFYVIDSLLSISLLTLSVVNLMFYNLNGIELIKLLLS